LRSSFESALDLLTLCSIVLLRKTSGGLDLLTEAQVVQRFARLATDLQALYAAYYIAELLADWTEDYDPHPGLFDEAVQALRDLNEPLTAARVGPRLVRFDLVLLRELGYSPLLDVCADCHASVTGDGLAFSAAAGGVVCGRCQRGQRDRRSLSRAAWEALRELGEKGDAWRQPWKTTVCAEMRQVLGGHVTYLLGRRPRMLPYLQGS
jgi:DNA repair protein RecO (recombination protein O)